MVNPKNLPKIKKPSPAKRKKFGTPPPVGRSLSKFGADIRIARIKRRLTVEMMANALGIHRTTFTRIEAGSPDVGLGHYANALFYLGLGVPFSEIAAPALDEIGLMMDIDRLPKRVRLSKGQPQSFHVPADVRRYIPPPRKNSDGILKIGVVGAMSGPYALWGLASKYAAEATASIYNDRGGVEIDGQRFNIEIIAVDDRLDPHASCSAVERLVTEDGVKYIIGPNVEQTVTGVAPIAEAHGAMLFPYSFTRSIYSPPFENAVLSQVAGYQAWPMIYRHLQQSNGIRSVGVVTPDTPEGRMQRQEAQVAARQAHLQVVPSEIGYKPGAEDLGPRIARVLSEAPDLIVLPNLAPAEAPKLIRGARDLGYRGLFATESAQDAKTLFETAGDDVNGFIMLGGASTPDLRSSYMEAFIERYVDLAGVWHDEGGTKAYALEFILSTLAFAGTEALTNIDCFKSAMQRFSMRDPFVREVYNLSYVGQEFFKQNRQLDVPLVVNVAMDGKFNSVLMARMHWRGHRRWNLQTGSN